MPALALCLAAANGANDLSKRIATLVGSGAGSPRRAALWGTLWTMAGALAAAFLATGLIKTFSGRGILSADALGPDMLAAVGPHAVLWGEMTRKVFVSLAFGPLISTAVLWLVWPLFEKGAAVLKGRCLCVTEPGPALASGFAPVAFIDAYSAAKRADCGGRTWLAPDLADSAHWLSAGLTCFARGMNDTPKVLALAAVGGTLGFPAFVLGALAMGAGGYWAGRRVTETLGERVTAMEPDQGLAANAVTAFLVVFASRWGLPVSTTHVASGAVIGLGLRRDPSGVRWDAVRGMPLTWVVTLPAAALLAAAAFRLGSL